MTDARKVDVVVIGGGNAALCAALTARERGAEVVLIEAAPRAMRGGNSRHTRNLRVMHEAPLEVLEDSYGSEEYVADLLRVTGGRTDEQLARLVIERSTDAYRFLRRQGVQFQRALSGTLSLSRTNAFFLGGGKALLNALYASAERAGVIVHYDTAVTGLTIVEGQITALDCSAPQGSFTLQPGAVVAAAGGFQANLEWLAEIWGPAAHNFVVRGTPFARGEVLRSLLDQGAAEVGDASQCHAIAVDGRAPQFDGGIVTRLDAIPYSIVVNRLAERFYDEGEDIWPKRYAIWGRLIAQQPDQTAWAICDARARDLFMPSVYPAIEADDIATLADRTGLDPAALGATVDSFNAACRNEERFDPAGLDGCTTAGLPIPKSNWARGLRTAPFSAWPLRPGITFTYLGVRVDGQGRVRTASGGAFDNLFAAGEMMAGSILGQGYLAGFGMAIGTVFGRLAGEGAARHVGH